MKRYFCRVEYDGAAFAGWQVQPDQVTVQSELERALSVVARTSVQTICGGRTDAGVHGRGQSIHFDLEHDIDCRRFQKGVNALLPDTVSVYGLREVSADFHARFSATKREYIYTITTRKSPLMNNAAALVTFSIDWEKVCGAAQQLVGTHVFTSFCAVGYYSDNHECTVDTVEVSFPADGVVTVRLVANRFVYKMVRTVIGTLIDIGRGKISMSMADIIAAQNRECAGHTAPAKGLTFEMVYYDAVS